MVSWVDALKKKQADNYPHSCHELYGDGSEGRKFVSSWNLGLTVSRSGKPRIMNPGGHHRR